MKTTTESRPTGNIHRQQLFYWFGADIDAQNKGSTLLKDELVKVCVERLRASLECGLWVKSPREPEHFEFNNHKKFSLDLPITCFTEWSLGESLPHTKKYGRIGLGFPKRWVIKNGGQSVTYFCHNQKMKFLKCIFELFETQGGMQDGIWKPKPDAPCFEALQYMLHFAKVIRTKRQSATGRIPATTVIQGRGTSEKKPRRMRAKAQNFHRKFGKPLDFVEEREWRIVYHAGNKNFVKGPGGPNGPDYYLPYSPGEELFTLVLPDAKVVSHVLQDKWLTKRLFKPGTPPVTLLSHSDLGTF